jgi:phage gp16-like protein
VNPEGIMFVLEMNNSINKIEGIGLVRNVAVAGKHRIYEDDNYNRYAYLGKTRISRDNMTKEEDALIRMLESHCFKGATHQKRGQGINFFPPNVLEEDDHIMDFIIGMFKRRL